MTERKDAYKDTLDSNWRENKDAIVNVKACFKKAESYEEILNKDLSDWNAKEIIDFYKSICTPSVDFLYNIHMVFKKYTVWCLHENLLIDNINHYDEISLDTLMQCINKSIADKRIISREDLLTELRKLDAPRDQFVCLACFEGLGGLQFNEIINLRLGDFDTERKVIRLPKREIPYSNELYIYARLAAETYTYTKEQSNQVVRVFQFSGDEDKIVKHMVSKEKSDTYNQEVKPQVIYNIIKAVKDSIDNPAFTSKALKESGRIDMVKKLLASNKDLTLENALKQTINRYGIIISYPAYITKYNDFLK